MKELNPSELALFSKLDGDQIETIQLTKIVTTGIVVLLCMLMVTCGASTITDRIMIGHVITTHQSQEIVTITK